MIALVTAAALLVLEVPTSLADITPELPAAIPLPVDDPEVPPDMAETPGPSPSRPYLRTAVETSLFLAAATVWYWRNPSYSDWDLKFNWASWKSKLFSDNDIVFDNNRFDTNTVVHPVGGLIYYQIARGNGLGPGASFITSLLASTVWEYVSEFNEKPSTNDLILTPAAGAVIGEATYRLGRFFAEGEPNLPNCIGALLFSPVATFNDSAVCRPGRGEPPFDRFGLPRRTWHQLRIGTGLARTAFDDGPPKDETTLVLSADIVGHRAYRRPGSGNTPVMPGQWTAVGSENLFRDRGLRGTWFHAESVIYGRYFRHYAEPAEGARWVEPNGAGALLALGTSFDYDARDLPFGQDRTGSAGLLGPMLELSARRGSVAVRLRTQAQYAFSLVQSLAYPSAAPLFVNEYIKTSLQDQGYYYAQGVNTLSTLRIDLGDIELDLLGRTASFWSFNRGDRFQGRLENNFALSDTRVYVQATAAARPFGGPLRIGLGFEQTYRGSHLPSSAFASTERRAGLSASLVF